VAQAAELLSVTSMTVTRWCESGRLPAIPKQYGRKMSYQIAPVSVEMMLAQSQSVKQAKQQQERKESSRPHSEYISLWLQSLRRGTLTGKVYSSETVEVYEYYVEGFFKRHNGLSFKTLEAELIRIPAKHFAKREKVFKSLLCFGKWLIRKQVLPESFLQDIKALTPKRHLPPKRTTVSPEGLDKLVAACGSILDETIVLLMANTGLRASEFCALKLEDIDLEKRFLTVRLGKGNKTRRVGLNDTAFEVLSRYLASLESKNPKSLIFHNSIGKPMDRNGLNMRLRRISKKAGIKVSPHSLRRAFVTINANKGRSLVMLQHACGHSDITTTRSYCLTTEQEVIDAMKDW
jgi:integrase/recombinase XerC